MISVNENKEKAARSFCVAINWTSEPYKTIWEMRRKGPKVSFFLLDLSLPDHFSVFILRPGMFFMLHLLLLSILPASKPFCLSFRHIIDL